MYPEFLFDLSLTCLYLLSVMKSLPTYGDRMMTRLAGKLTPAANVDVQQITHKTPHRNASSKWRRSSAVNPEWWYAMPHMMLLPRIGHIALPISFSIALIKLSRSANLCSVNFFGSILHNSFAKLSQFRFVEQKIKQDFSGITSDTSPATWSGSFFSASALY